MDMTGMNADIHLRTDANNLVTTAQTTRQPEHKETLHLINQLRHETCSGQIDDLSHVITTEMMADCLTKKSERVPADTLVKAVRTGWIPNADKAQPFREMMRNKHKAFSADSLYLAEFCVRHISRAKDQEEPAIKPTEILTFFGLEISKEIQYVYGTPDWCMTLVPG